MQTDAKGQTFAVGTIGVSDAAHEPEVGLINKIQSLLAPYGVGSDVSAKALNEALLEVRDRSIDNSPEDQQLFLLELTLWKIFAKGSAFWVNSQTESGNPVPEELLVAAFSIWKNAANLATRQGIDSAVSAEAMAQATYATADQLARNRQNPESKEIKNIRQYLFTVYMHSISGISLKQGSKQINFAKLEEWIEKRELSDRGAFQEVVENGLFCHELLQAMTPRGRSVAVTRYILGYSWPETAGALGTSINAAQKALSIGVRKALGTCMQELRRVGGKKVVEIESHLLKNKKNSSLREITE